MYRIFIEFFFLAIVCHRCAAVALRRFSMFRENKRHILHRLTQITVWYGLVLNNACERQMKCVCVCVRLSKWERYVCDMYSISSLQIAKLFTIYTKWLCSRRHRISNESNVKWLLATDVTAISSECEIECVIVLVVCRSDGCSRGEGIDGSKNEGPDEGRGLESCKLRRNRRDEANCPTCVPFDPFRYTPILTP